MLMSIIASRCGVRMAPSPRICRFCTSSDLLNFGFAHLRVLHQVPGIHFCQHHGSALHDQCAHCHASIAIDGPWRLTGGGCSNCNGDETTASFAHNESPGSKSFSLLLQRILGGSESKQLLHAPTREQMRRIYIGKPHSPQQLLRQFLDWWRVETVDDLALILDTEINVDRTVTFLRGNIQPLPYPLLTALAAFTRHLASDPQGFAQTD